MSQQDWNKANQINMLTINSWKQSLLKHNENSAKSIIKNNSRNGKSTYQDGGTINDLEENMKSCTALLTEINRCRQIRAFPPRPDITDLIPQKHPTDQESQAEMVTLTLIRKLKRQKLSRISNTAVNQEQQDQGSKLETDTAHFTIGMESESPNESTDTAEIDLEMLSKFKATVETLRGKLEILQPEGSRPSDIAIKLANNSLSPKIGGGNVTTEELGNSTGNMENELILSQDIVSQRSIFIWDEIRTIVELSNSTTTDIRNLAVKSISELGIENLEDGVLHRLCTNEIFTNDMGDDDTNTTDNEDTISDSSKILSLSYQSIQSLCCVLFRQKALSVRSIPSRLFLDAVLCAGKRHGRAVIDSVLLPLMHDLSNFSKLTSEIIQKVMKEQSSASMVHFLSCAFEPIAIGGRAPGEHGSTILDNIPVLFYSEIYLSTIQSLLSYNNVPTPLPTRLWTRFNAVLSILWEKISSIVMSITTSTSPIQFNPSTDIGTLKDAITSKNEIVWIIRMYCSPQTIEVLVQSARSKDVHGENVASSGNNNHDQGNLVRISNPKLVQLLMVWTMRQGPVCSDMENLQKLRDFCAVRLDVKQAKGLVAKLDMLIKKKR